MWLHRILQTDCSREQIVAMPGSSKGGSKSPSLAPALPPRDSVEMPQPLNIAPDTSSELDTVETSKSKEQATSADDDPAEVSSGHIPTTSDPQTSGVSNLATAFRALVQAERAGSDVGPRGRPQSVHNPSSTCIPPSRKPETKPRDDQGPTELSVWGILKLIKAQPRLMTHICALKDTVAHSHSIALDEHTRILAQMKAEHTRLVEYLRSQVVQNQQVITDLRSTLKVQHQQHEEAVLQQEETHRAILHQHAEREATLLASLERQEKENAELRDKIVTHERF